LLSVAKRSSLLNWKKVLTLIGMLDTLQLNHTADHSRFSLFQIFCCNEDRIVCLECCFYILKASNQTISGKSRKEIKVFCWFMLCDIKLIATIIIFLLSSLYCHQRRVLFLYGVFDGESFLLTSLQQWENDDHPFHYIWEKSKLSMSIRSVWPISSVTHSCTCKVSYHFNASLITDPPSFPDTINNTR
jgi:hypothetical protein